MRPGECFSLEVLLGKPAERCQGLVVKQLIAVAMRHEIYERRLGHCRVGIRGGSGNQGAKYGLRCLRIPNQKQNAPYRKCSVPPTSPSGSRISSASCAILSLSG